MLNQSTLISRKVRGKWRIGAPNNTLFNSREQSALVVTSLCHYKFVMEELLRSNNIITLSFVQSLMRDAGIEALWADRNMSTLEGSIGAIPQRILVDSDRIVEARRIIVDAGLEKELRDRPDHG